MDDAHPSELAGAASSSGEKQNARRVAWVEHRSTTSDPFSALYNVTASGLHSTEINNISTNATCIDSASDRGARADYGIYTVGN
jgi:hypothetical protein